MAEEKNKNENEFNDEQMRAYLMEELAKSQQNDRIVFTPLDDYSDTIREETNVCNANIGLTLGIGVTQDSLSALRITVAQKGNYDISFNTNDNGEYVYDIIACNPAASDCLQRSLYDIVGEIDAMRVNLGQEPVFSYEEMDEKYSNEDENEDESASVGASQLVFSEMLQSVPHVATSLFQTADACRSLNCSAGNMSASEFEIAAQTFMNVASMVVVFRGDVEGMFLSCKKVQHYLDVMYLYLSRVYADKLDLDRKLTGETINQIAKAAGSDPIMQTLVLLRADITLLQDDIQHLLSMSDYLEKEEEDEDDEEN